MNKNIKKGKPVPNSLIALGNNNKTRNTLPPQTQQAKKAKTDDLNPKILINAIEQTFKQDNVNCEATLNNFLTSLKTALIFNNKPIKTYLSQFLALFAICKRFQSLFTRPAVVDCMVGVLCYSGKELSTTSGGLTSSYKPQSSLLNATAAAKIRPLHITLSHIIVASFRDVKIWPVQLLKAYLDDSFGDRVWVDLPECHLLVHNIETAFPGPSVEPRSLFPLGPFSEPMQDILGVADGQSSTAVVVAAGDAGEHSDARSLAQFCKVMTALSGEECWRPRFDGCRPLVDQAVNAWLKDIAERRFISDTQSRPIIRAFCALAGLPEVRSAAVAKTDNWLSTGKLLASTLHMLTIMASSCTHNIVHNAHDINFCAYLMFRFKYKMSKPPVQTALLDCLRKVTETHPSNLRTVLEIYINNEIYGSATAPTAANNLVPIAYSPQNKSGPVSVSFPAVFFRYPSESVKILGDLLHEQLCLLYTDTRPVKLLIRDLCRWIKVAHLNTNGVYTALVAPNGSLPDSLELHELAQTLLADRSSNDLLVTRMSDTGFRQAYVENMISVVCELQMLSVVRPAVGGSFKERADPAKRDCEALKSHYNTLRQIRYFTCKWLKNIFRMVESQVTADQMTNYIKQVLFLNVTRNNDFTYFVDESYLIGDIWNNETDKMLLIKGLTEVPLSDKLLQTLINLAFEKHMCFRPSEIVNMISELIIRASASADADIVPLSLVKSESIINSMFACCSYDVALDENDAKLQIARTLAYKSSFWKVCQALVIMASYCTNNCGSYLWNNFPTVKNLLQIIITNNFDELCNDKEAMETERQFCETDATKICELETLLVEATGEEVAPIDPSNSKLVNLLLFNLPQGPVRQPPLSIIESLKSINAIMKVGDRLSQCRSPDFLFEIVREQDQSKISSRKWIIDLVKKTSEHNLDCLPLLCLTEFIYHDMYEKISGNLHIVSKNDSKDASLKRLVLKIRQILCGGDTDARQGGIDKESLKNIVGALSNSFFNRLSYSSAFVRRVARECLYILLQPLSSPIALMDSSAQFVDTLKSIMNLNILQDNARICAVAEALRETLKFETDIDVIYSYVNLFALMSSGSHKEWLANTVETLSILLLNRPIIADKLRSRDYETVSRNSKPASPLICDALAEIFLAHINYTAYQAQVVALEHRDEAVMVTLKQDKQFPVVVKVIQSQLSLVCWGVAKSKKCKKLIDFWFTKSVTNATGNASHTKFHLPTFSSIEPHSALPEIVPQWLANAAVHSGVSAVMQGILNHRLHHHRQVSHALTPAMAFTAPDFIKSYLNVMNAFLKSSDKALAVDSWLTECATTGKIPGMVATVTRMHSKVKGVDSLFKVTLESMMQQSSASMVDARQPPNLKPTLIVVARPRLATVAAAQTARTQEPMEVSVGGAAVELEDNSWANVIQENSMPTISRSIGALLEATEHGTLVHAIESIFRLLKDTRTHSETLRVLNKADYKLLPLLALSFRSSDQSSFDKAMQSFRYLFNAYPHIEKAPLWKVVYNLSLAQGLTVARLTAADFQQPQRPLVTTVANDNIHSNGKLQSSQMKSLAKSIFNCQPEDAAKIGSKIDQLTILGLGNGHLSDSHCDTVAKLLFASHAAPHTAQFSDYFMSDLLHQSNVVSLRRILHSLLQQRRSSSTMMALSQMNASRVLDFITACVRHPRLQYAVALPNANRHIWPQQNSEIDLTDAEMVNLLQLVVSEAEHLIEQNGPSSPLVHRALNRRCRLVEVCCSSGRSIVGRRHGLINRFIDAKPHNFAMEQFSFALYSRLPGLIAPPTPLSSRDLSSSTTADIGNYSVKEIHRIGQRLLAGLVNPRPELQELANQSLKALVSRHPRLCVQLLPFMCALSDGALDGTDSWMDFRRRRGQSLYTSLLHLLEMMAPLVTLHGNAGVGGDSSVRASTRRIVDNFLRVLIRYREQHVFFTAFAARLVAFLERVAPADGAADSRSASPIDESIDNKAGLLLLLNQQEKQPQPNKSIPSDRDDSGAVAIDFLVEHAVEITALSSVFPQFRNLIRCHKDGTLPAAVIATAATTAATATNADPQLPSNTAPSTATALLDPDDSRASQLPLLKLEYLMNFRRKLRDSHSGNGVLVLIRDLDDVSKRDANIIGLFMDDLRSLIGHSMNDVRLAAVQILVRYLNAFPEQSARIVADCVGSQLMKSGGWYWARPFVNLALKALCQVGMLAPNVVPVCLANHARLLVAGNNGRGSFRESIELLEVIIDNASLESFMESAPAYTCKPLMMKKDLVTVVGQNKRHYQDSADTGEIHKAKRSRYK